jgi:hypothetical protein
MHGVPLIQQNFDQTMAIQKISELNSAPIKSKFYLVPCIQVPAWVQGEFEGGYKRLDWVPILEPIHDDHELGFTIKHYHYDLRFSKILVGAATVIAVNEKMTKIRFPTEETEITNHLYHSEITIEKSLEPWKFLIKIKDLKTGYALIVEHLSRIAQLVLRIRR